MNSFLFTTAISLVYIDFFLLRLQSQHLNEKSFYLLLKIQSRSWQFSSSHHQCIFIAEKKNIIIIWSEIFSHHDLSMCKNKHLCMWRNDDGFSSAKLRKFSMNKFFHLNRFFYTRSWNWSDLINLINNFSFSLVRNSLPLARNFDEIPLEWWESQNNFFSIYSHRLTTTRWF